MTDQDRIEAEIARLRERHDRHEDRMIGLSERQAEHQLAMARVQERVHAMEGDVAEIKRDVGQIKEKLWIRLDEIRDRALTSWPIAAVIVTGGLFTVIGGLVAANFLR